jgi:hypothetical protein
MRFSDVIALALPAYCHLPNGSVLRYRPTAGGVQEMAYPDTPSAWKQAPFFTGTVPEEGWTHLAGCLCAHCVGSSRADLAS